MMDNVSNIRLGYACINTFLQKNHKITTNRSMIKRTFKKKGVEYASELARRNVEDLFPILVWNYENNIKLFRMSSCLFPWASEYKFTDLPDYEDICIALKKAGDYSKEKGIRLSFHPGPFNILSSPKEHVVKNCVTDLKMHGEVMDLMGLPRNHNAKINIHIGASYGDRDSALKRWCKNFKLLPESVSSRLTVENDDKANLYSVKDLYNGAFKKVGVPIVFDFHHHKFCTGDLTEEEALDMAYSTWNNIRPTCHYSESAAEKEGKKVRANAHSDFVYDRINNYSKGIDVILEAKAKEKALFKYRELYSN